MWVFNFVYKSPSQVVVLLSDSYIHIHIHIYIHIPIFYNKNVCSECVTQSNRFFWGPYRVFMFADLVICFPPTMCCCYYYDYYYRFTIIYIDVSYVFATDCVSSCPVCFIYYCRLPGRIWTNQNYNILLMPLATSVSLIIYGQFSHFDLTNAGWFTVCLFGMLLPASL